MTKRDIHVILAGKEFCASRRASGYTGMVSLFWYKFLFMAELLIIEGMFTYKLRRRKLFWLRLALCVAVLFLVAWLFPVRYDPLYGSMMFLTFFVLTIAAMAVCFSDRFMNILFCGLAAYTVQHIAYLVYTIIVNAFTDNPGNVYQSGTVELDGMTLAVMLAVYFASYIMVYVETYFLLIAMIPRHPDLQLGRTNMIIVSLLVLIVDIVFNMYTVYNVNADPLSTMLEEVYNLLICLFILYMQFQRLRQKKIITDYDIIYNILQKEQQQFRKLKQNMDIINVKCHDIKHQLHKVPHGDRVDLAELQSVEQAISIYANVAQTGNETLDIVLTDKMLSCEPKGIEITCMADGKCLSFMREEDIYSLFGNALDNAIAAVEQLDEPEREIKVLIKNLGDIVSVRVENKYKGQIKLKNGLPVTTQKDLRYHGFGILSMQMLAARYNGKLNVDVSGGTFVLNIVFVQAQPKQTEHNQNEAEDVRDESSDSRG